MALTNAQRKKMFLRLLTKWFLGQLTPAQATQFANDVAAAVGTGLDSWLDAEKTLALSEANAAKTAAVAQEAAADAEIASLG